MASAPTYWSYLRLDQLLSLQDGLEGDESRLMPDELHFILVHQTMELWFKLVPGRRLPCVVVSTCIAFSFKTGNLTAYVMFRGMGFHLDKVKRLSPGSHGLPYLQPQV